MGNFIFLLVIVISVLVLQLFECDPAVKMEEMVRSARYGKQQLDSAGITAAYLTASVLYVCSMVSLALLVTILLKNILASGAFMVIFMVMLVICNQIYLYPVNHWFTNFMPIRMTDFWHFYTGNELYRIFGHSISCMSWSIVVSLILSVVFLVTGLTALHVYRKKGVSG